MHKVHSINTKIHEIKYKNQIHLTNPQSTLDETQRKMTTKFNIFLGNRWWQWNYNDSSNVASHIALWMANHLVSNIEGRGLSQATDILHQLQDFLRQLLSEQMAAASLVFIFKTEGRGTESERYAETWWIKVNHSNRISHEISVRLLLGLTIWVACAHIGTGNINRSPVDQPESSWFLDLGSLKTTLVFTEVLSTHTMCYFRLVYDMCLFGSLFTDMFYILCISPPVPSPFFCYMSSLGAKDKWLRIKLFRSSRSATFRLICNAPFQPISNLTCRIPEPRSTAKEATELKEALIRSNSLHFGKKGWRTTSAINLFHQRNTGRSIFPTRP